MTKSTPTTKLCSTRAKRELRIDLAHDATVGERSRILKFSMHNQDQSMESSSNEGKRSASTYPCRSRAEACQGDGDDGVVLERDSDHR